MYKFKTSFTRITTLDSTNFKVWEDGVLISTYPTHSSNEVSLTKTDDGWATAESDTHSIEVYDDNFNRTTSHDVSGARTGDLYDVCSVGEFIMFRINRTGTYTIKKDGTIKFTFNGYWGRLLSYDGNKIYSKSITSNDIRRVRPTPIENGISTTLDNTELLSAVANGVVNGISVVDDILYVLYNTRLIKSYNKNNITFIKDVYTLGESGTFNDFFVEHLIIQRTVSVYPTSTLGIRTDAITRPVKKVSAVNYGLRFITISPAIDKIGETEFGRLKAIHNANGTNETGITKYNNMWFTCDNGTDFIRRYNLDFSYVGFVNPDQLVVPVGATVFKQYLVILNRTGANYSAQFYTGNGVYRFQAAIGTGDYRAIASDNVYIYLYKLSDRKIVRRAVTLGTNSASLGPETEWTITDGGIRGMRVLGDMIYTANTSRQIREFAKSDGTGGDIILTLDSSAGSPQGLYAEYATRPIQMGFSTKVTVKIHRLKKAPATDRLGISTDTDTTKIRKVSEKQTLGLTDTVSSNMIHRERVDQRLGIRTKIKRDRLRLKTRSVTQTLGIHSTNRIKLKLNVAQRLGIRTVIKRDKLRLKRRRVTDRLGVRTDTKTTRIQYQIVRVTQRLGLSTDTTKRFVRRLSTVQRLGIRTDANAGARLGASVSDRLGIRTDTKLKEKLIRFGFDRIGLTTKTRMGYMLKVADRLGISTVPVKKLFAKPADSIGIRTVASRDRVRLVVRAVVQTLGIRTTKKVKFKVRVTQRLGIRKAATQRRLRLKKRAVKDALGIRDDVTTHRTVHRDPVQTLGLRTVARATGMFVRKVIQMLGIGGRGAPVLPSSAPEFDLKNRIRKVFRV